METGPTASGDVVLAQAGGGGEIVVSPAESSIVKQAAEFLAGDIEKISGYKPPIVDQPTAGRVSIRLQTLGNGKVPSGIDAKTMQGQWESYRVLTDGKGVWLVGSDPRGTAYAAYTLSERLGIDPLYIWTGYVPDHHDPLVLKKTRFVQAPPTFKYRGFFHDDEDILPRPFDARGYPMQLGDVPLDWYRKFFETALRLRMNMVAPYTRVHRRFEVQKLASDWGLYYTSHHYDVLLSNPFGLTRFNLAEERGVKPDWNWFTNRDGMLKYWRAGVEENKDIDAIWPVGMRGTEDRGYTFPPGTTDEQKAEIFHDVIQAQVDTVKALLPKDKTPIFHFTMYTEMLPEYEQHQDRFNLPADVIIVWPDDNNGHMRGLPKSLGKWKHGVYYHLAYLGGNLSKQVTHIVAPQTIAEEFQKIVNAGATEFMLVNTSETREYVMGARMLADITWDAPAVYAQPDPAKRFTAWWTREYFGGSPAQLATSPNAATKATPAGTSSGAPEAAEVAYNAYFSLLTTPDRLWYAANAIQNLLVRLHERVTGGTPAPVNADTLAELQAADRSLREALQVESGAEQRMTMDQRRFFHEDVALGLLVDELQTQAALKLVDAVNASDAAAMWAAVLDARTPLEQLETELAREEYPPFDRWYHETWIRSALSSNNPHRSYNQVRDFIGTDGREAVERQVFRFPRPAQPPAQTAPPAPTR